MTDLAERFSQEISARRRELADRLLKDSLYIAVLGPNLKDIGNPGTLKRHQIADSLENDGHITFFPENHVQYTDPSMPWVDQERELLSDSSVDLVIILHTDHSAGVLMEIGNFVSVPEISLKTAVLCPTKHYKPTENLFGNTVQYFTNMQYTDEHLASCELVAECKQWAYTLQKGKWPSLQSEVF